MSREEPLSPGRATPAGPARGETAYLGLGTNLGDRVENLCHGLALLHGEGIRILRCSSVYESDPVGPVQDQPPFLNLAARAFVDMEPLELLRRCQRVEETLGRDREAEEPKGPRILDVDVLLLGDRVTRDNELILPHPELLHRAFVVLPLLELDPGLVDPRDGRPIGAHAARLEQEQGICAVHDPLPLPGEDRGTGGSGAVHLLTLSALRLHRVDLPPTPGPSLLARVRALARRALGRVPRG